MADLRDFTGKNRKNTGVAGERIAISNTAARVNEKGRLRYNESLELMEYYNGTSWISIDAPPTISGVSPLSINIGDATTTFTLSGSNFSASGLTATLINNGGTEISFTTVTRNSDTSITAVLTNSNVGAVDEPYDIKVTNGSGLANTFADSINVNEAPAWVTASGSLGTLFHSGRSAANLSTSTIEATDPEGGDVDYVITVGSLPSGLTLNGETGAISGTADSVGSNTTSTFTVQARDTASNIATRQFSITVNAPSLTQFTSTGAFTFNVPSGISSVTVLAVGAGGGGGGNIAGGGGAGGLVESSSYPVTPGGSVPGSVGTGGSGGQGRNSPGSTGGNTVFGAITAYGGGSGGGGGSDPEAPVAAHSGSPGGSGGGGSGYANTQNVGTSTQTNFAPVNALGYGNSGGTGISNASGGGGGAGGAGQSYLSSDQAGNGGVGRQNDILGPNHYWAGGGGGATYDNRNKSGNGGLGGGGGGGNMGPNVGTGGGSALSSGQNGINNPNTSSPAVSGGAGGTNTGGGGGGGTHDLQGGGSGGPGIVVVAV